MWTLNEFSPVYNISMPSILKIGNSLLHFLPIPILFLLIAFPRLFYRWVQTVLGKFVVVLFVLLFSLIHPFVSLFFCLFMIYYYALSQSVMDGSIAFNGVNQNGL